MLPVFMTNIGVLVSSETPRKKRVMSRYSIILASTWFSNIISLAPPKYILCIITTPSTPNGRQYFLDSDDNKALGKFN